MKTTIDCETCGEPLFESIEIDLSKYVAFCQECAPFAFAGVSSSKKVRDVFACVREKGAPGHPEYFH